MTTPDHPDFYDADVDTQVTAFIEEHRAMIASSLDGLSESEVRRQLVSSKTTLLGLVKHATFVERVWFEEARTGTSRAESGLPAGPDESFVLAPEDTIGSVRSAFEAACEASRAAVHSTHGRDIWSGNRRGPLTLHWIMMQVLREHAQHCGHADILREQILDAR